MKLTNVINQNPPTYLFTLLFTISILGIHGGFHLHGGEEQYLAFAKQFMNPNWIPNSFTLSEFAGTRWVFQVIWGSLLLFLDFETVTFFSRLLSYVFFGWALSLIFKELKLNFILSITILLVFITNEQSFYAGEWIIWTFEPKVVAYNFIFFSIYFLLRNENQKSLLFIALAGYFHIIVAFWFGFSIVLYLLFERKFRFKEVLVYGVIPILPFLSYMVYGYSIHQSVVETTSKELDWVYSYLRLAGHCGIYYKAENYWDGPTFGILWSLLALAFSFVLAKKWNSSIRIINRLTIILISTNLFFAVLAYVDHFYLKETLGYIFKYYPFRMNSLALLFTFIQIVYLLNQYLVKIKSSTYLLIFILIGCLILFAVRTSRNIENQIKFSNDTSKENIYNYINKNTLKKDQFVLLHLPEKEFIEEHFTRNTERESYHVYKFVAAEKSKLAQWYNRNQEVYRLSQDISYIEKWNYQNDNVNYIFSGKKLSHPFLIMVFQDVNFQIYKIKKPSEEGFLKPVVLKP